MIDQKKVVIYSVAKKIKDIITDVLATGDWGNSEFLQVSARGLHDLTNKIDKLISLVEQNKQDEKAIDVGDKVAKMKIVPSGYCQVFILLYQVENTNLQSWYKLIKNLAEHNVSKPVYKDENHVKEFIRSKKTNIEHNGYVVVNVKNDDFYNEEKLPVDSCGHDLFMLKENAISLENIIEFVLANGQHYAVCDNALISYKG
jgi:intracellular multiplication protein IcmQ